MSTTIRYFSLVCCVATWVAAGGVSAQQRDDTKLRQIAGILDYIGSDYAGAVTADGTVVSQLEYDEQLSLVQEATRLAHGAGLGASDPVSSGLVAVEQALTRKARPPEVLALCRSTKASLVRAHGVVLVPESAPDRARAAELYRAQACNGCHGDDGRADTAAAALLTPRPANFQDDDRMAGVSPQRAFYAITFGVQGTGMTSFDRLPASDRWSLAFYVLGMRWDGRENDSVTGARTFARVGRPLRATPANLSGMTDDDIRAAIARKVPNARDQRMVLGFLRSNAPFGAGGRATFEVAREQMRQALVAYERGDRARARQGLLSAYLDGIEPHEAGLRARDESLVIELERSMLELREAVVRGDSLASVQTRAARVSRAIDRADAGAGSSQGGSAFFGAFAIALREGLEAALLIGALLGLVRRRGVPQHAKFVHAGWLAAVPAGLLTWLLAGSVIGGLERELAEGIVGILAAVVLLGVTHWIVGQASAREWMGFLSKRVGRAAAGPGAAWAVATLAFIAAYREAFEIVLFFQALLLEARNAQAMVWIGALAGLGVLAIAVLVLKQLGQRLPMKPFMLGSSVLLAVLSVMLIGKGVHSLQEAGIVPLTSLALPEVRFFGVFATMEGLIAQGVLVALLAASAIYPWMRARRAAAEDAAANAAATAAANAAKPDAAE